MIDTKDIYLFLGRLVRGIPTHSRVLSEPLIELVDSFSVEELLVFLLSRPSISF